MATTTFGLIDGQFKICQGYADEAIKLVTGTGGFLSTMINLASGVAPVIDSSWISYAWPAPSIDTIMSRTRPDMPTAADLADMAITVPALPELNVINIPTLPVMPKLDATPPQVILPSPPSTDMPAEPGNAPPIGDITTPVKPDYTLPIFPNLNLPAIPIMPEIIRPQFEGGELPSIDLNQLENTFFFSEAVYQSDSLEALKNALATYAADGKTGLPDSIMQSIWNQAQLRTESENEKIFEEALNFWAARGWSLPPGMLSARLSEARVEISRANADINEKITIEQARLAQTNTQFVLKTIVDLESQLMTYSGQVAARALDGSKAAMQAALDIYNANIARYNLMLDGYKTAASVYETRVRAAILGLEQYKSQLEAVKLSSELEMYKVDAYKAQVQGALSLIELYKTEMQAATISLEVDKLRIDAFKTTVDVYATKVQAKTAQYNMYQAQIAGEKSKVELYTEQVKAYTGILEGYKTNISAIQTQVAIKADINKNAIMLYQSDIDRYKADVMRSSAHVENIIKAYGLQTQVYDSDIKAATSSAEAEIEIYKGRVQQAKNQTDILLSQAEANLKAFMSNREFTIEANKNAANVASQLAASAMSAVHASASGGYSYGVSYDDSKGIPSTTYSYNHSD